jgi:uncharacterized membrane protein
MNEKVIHQLFEVGVWLKGLHSVLEIVGGLLLWAVSADAITQFVVNLTADEVANNPRDLVAGYLFRWALSFSVGQKVFAAFYLLSHGVVKLFLVVGLLRRQLWAYPASLVVLGLFIAYQVYRYTFTHSLALIALTVFDVVVIWLIWQEYRVMLRHLVRA